MDFNKPIGPEGALLYIIGLASGFIVGIAVTSGVLLLMALSI